MNPGEFSAADGALEKAISEMTREKEALGRGLGARELAVAITKAETALLWLRHAGVLIYNEESKKADE
jgi:hypothetical protein